MLLEAQFPLDQFLTVYSVARILGIGEQIGEFTQPVTTNTPNKSSLFLLEENDAR